MLDYCLLPHSYC